MESEDRESSIIIKLFNGSEEVKDVIQNIKSNIKPPTVTSQLIQIDNDTAKIISEEISSAGITSRLVTLLKQVCRLNRNSRAIAITPLLNETIIVNLVDSVEGNVLCAIEALFLLLYILKSLPVNAYILEFLIRILYAEGPVRDRLPTVDIEGLRSLNKSVYWRLTFVCVLMQMVFNLNRESDGFVRIEDYFNLKNDSLLETTLVALWQVASNSNILYSIDTSCAYYELFSGTFEKIENTLMVHLTHQLLPLWMILHVMLKIPKESMRQEIVIFLHSLLMIQQLCRCNIHSKKISFESFLPDLYQRKKDNDRNGKEAEEPENDSENKTKTLKTKKSRRYKTQIALSSLRTTIFITNDYMLDLCIDDNIELFIEMFNRRAPCQRMLELSGLCAKEGIFSINLVFQAANNVYKIRDIKHKPKDKKYTASSIKKAVNTANKLFNTIVTSMNYENLIGNIIKNHLLKGNKMRQALEHNYEELVSKLLTNYIQYSSTDNKSSQDYWILCSNASRKATLSFQQHLDIGDTETERVTRLTKTNIIVFPIPLKLVHLQLVLNPSVKSLALCVVSSYIFSFVEKRRDVESILIPKGNAAVNKLIVKDTVLRLVKDGNPACRLLAVNYISKYLFYSVKCGDVEKTQVTNTETVDYIDDDSMDSGDEENEDVLLNELMNQVDSQSIQPNSQNKMNVTASRPQLHTISMRRFAFSIILSCMSDRSRTVQDAATSCALKRFQREYMALSQRGDVVERAKAYSALDSTVIPALAKGIVVLDNDIHGGCRPSVIEAKVAVLRGAIVLVVEMLVDASESGLVGVPETKGKRLSLADALTLCVQKLLTHLIPSSVATCDRENISNDIRPEDIPLETLKSVIHRVALAALVGETAGDGNDACSDGDVPI